jgi:hypothetical protein
MGMGALHEQRFTTIDYAFAPNPEDVILRPATLQLDLQHRLGRPKDL